MVPKKLRDHAGFEPGMELMSGAANGRIDELTTLSRLPDLTTRQRRAVNDSLPAN